MSRLQNLLPLIQDSLGASEMNICRSEQSDGAVVMFVVVLAEEFSCPSSGICLTSKSFGIIGAVLQGFELRFGKRIVVGDMRS